ncbi:MAG: hypothetical protein QOG85_1305 [Gaiellaceae bacterium]|jgi:hypothetical protein|nr:hypothetical protein [Gaiellaceae bacterium]
MFACYTWENADVVDDWQHSGRFHLWMFVILSVDCAIAAFLLLDTTHGWSYLGAPALAAVMIGSLELLRSDVPGAVGSAVAAFIDTAILIILLGWIQVFLDFTIHL